MLPAHDRHTGSDLRPVGSCPTRHAAPSGPARDRACRPNARCGTNKGRPGFSGPLGALRLDEKVNIASFNLGRSAAGADAISLIEVDGAVADPVLERVRGLEGVVQARRLSF